jgi:hypothetical protein
MDSQRRHCWSIHFFTRALSWLTNVRKAVHLYISWRKILLSSFSSLVSAAEWRRYCMYCNVTSPHHCRKTTAGGGWTRFLPTHPPPPRQCSLCSLSCLYVYTVSLCNEGTFVQCKIELHIHETTYTVWSFIYTIYAIYSFALLSTAQS